MNRLAIDPPLKKQLESQGILNQAVISALMTVPRDQFVSPQFAALAHEDCALPIEEGQTISQPYMVAYMLEQLQLKPTDSVLEIGTGSGYGAAVLSRLVEQVYTIERHPFLSLQAQKRLQLLNAFNVITLIGDGTLGVQKYAPYDAIIVTAQGPFIPEPLLKQLKVGGRLIMPIGQDDFEQDLVIVHQIVEGHFEQETLSSVAFVPLIGEKGWPESY